MNICFEKVYTTALANLIPCALRELVKGIWMHPENLAADGNRVFMRDAAPLVWMS